jgi:hypothetical protein
VADYENARTIINGHDKAANIADIARRFSEVLLASAACVVELRCRQGAV